MHSIKRSFSLAGLIVFLVTFIVYLYSIESTGSLWDCGEFILGAYKQEVVHPPGAPLFLLVGRMFAWVGSMVSDDPRYIAMAVNLMSAICTSFAAVFAGWTAMMFSKICLVGRDGETDSQQNVALLFAGVAAGLATAFSTSVWFSAVEGEVYAMALFFTALAFWAGAKWYYLPDEKTNDHWLVFAMFASGLSVGVHLLGLLTLPSLAIFYYFKKYPNPTVKGFILSILAGLGMIAFVQKGIVTGIPTLWMNFEIFMVNSMGLEFHSGLIPTFIVIAALGYFVLKYAHKKGYQLLQYFAFASLLIISAFMTMGVIVVRSIADTPVNMNVPSDAIRLLPYLNREQYGERALLYGPDYTAQYSDVKKTPRYGRVGDHYEYTDMKYEYVYKKSDMELFPRVGHSDRADMHNLWREVLDGSKPKGSPGYWYNIEFFFKYQLGWMYWRYFMWNFVGRENGKQGYLPWDVRDGHWESGFKALDDARLFNTDVEPDTMKNDPAKNHYFFLPLIFGLLGLFFHFTYDKKTFLALLMFFLISGIGIIIFSNQPPNEPRERDYVLVSSFMAFCIWIGMAVPFIHQMLRSKLNNVSAPIIAGLLVVLAPVVMGFQNFDDHSRRGHTAARDYASNFLNSVEPNAIIFTYGDNDTYPLWYAQEVENIRRDVRVVNLSLIAVDWYIEKLRWKVNDSEPIKLTMTENDYLGKNLNQVYLFSPSKNENDIYRPVTLDQVFKFITSPSARQPYDGDEITVLPFKNYVIPIDKERFAKTGFMKDTTGMTDYINIRIGKNTGYLTKDDLAIMDIINSNIYDRPIYFAITCKNDKLLGLNDFTELQGLALKVVPKITPSDKNLGIYGSGTVDTDIAYDNIMNKWKWGGFDKIDTYVSTSYMAGVQSMRMAMMRTALQLVDEGKPEKAKNIANKFFEAFPQMNFPYDATIIPFINILIETKDYDSAKKHMLILADETKQYMDFYQSLEDDEFTNFEDDLRYTYRCVTDLLSMSTKVEDPEFEKKIKDMMGSYTVENVFKR